MPLQPLHLQELQLLSGQMNAPSPGRRGCQLFKFEAFILKQIPIYAALLSIVPSAAAAQSMDMPGMHMPAAKKPAPKKKAPAKHPARAHHRTEAAPAPVKKAPAAQEQMPGMEMPTPEAAAPPAPMSGMNMPMGQQAGHDMNMGHEMKMTGALGSYPMERESSGTSWQPDASRGMGSMSMSGDWMLMADGVLNLVYDHQSGRRGDDKGFASGMLMGMARRPIGNGTLQLRGMLSPDPIMGPSGYPLLLASGETANGRDPLIDRQHPHDFLMELAASVSQDIGGRSSVFLYGGLPGEPAFGPPAFMHREAILDSPEAPISHHWLDSTHITFGVLTAGLVVDRMKLEVSRFNGREPDQHRWNIETGPLDSTAVRISWNPTRTLALQGSWGHLIEPEQLEPGVNQNRLSASALWADEIAPGWKAAATLAWGRKTVEHHNDDAFAAEASVKRAGWTIFGRGEMTENRELLGLHEDGPAFRVGKVSLGAVRDFPIARHLTLGAGGLFAVNFVPDALAAAYGGRNPIGAMTFVRLKLN